MDNTWMAGICERVERTANRVSDATRLNIWSYKSVDRYCSVLEKSAWVVGALVAAPAVWAGVAMVYSPAINMRVPSLADAGAVAGVLGVFSGLAGYAVANVAGDGVMAAVSRSAAKVGRWAAGKAADLTAAEKALNVKPMSLEMEKLTAMRHQRRSDEHARKQQAALKSAPK